jgi:Ca2+/H+ antiporter, TMEM165/GDT1 family
MRSSSSSSLLLLHRRVRTVPTIHNHIRYTTGTTTTQPSSSLCRLRQCNSSRMMMLQQQFKVNMYHKIYLCVMILIVALLPHTILGIDTTTNNNDIKNPDLFDKFDMNHDTMIDRNEYNIGITNFIHELQFKSNIQLQQQPPPSSSSFTSWLLHDIFSYPTSLNTNGESSAAGATTTTLGTTNTGKNGNNGGIISIWHGFWNAFTSSVAMILATEIGDKTFFIAAILSMKHSRSIIFIGSILALIIMTIISTGMGLILPKFLDRKYTHILSGILFLYFGIKLIYDSSLMEHGKVSEELEEVEEELLHPTKKKMLLNKKKGDDDDTSTNDIEIGNNNNNNTSNNNNKKSSSSSSNHTLMMNQLSTTYTIIMMAFTLTFVAEWGDRSQIATIALASSKNPIGVTIGSIIGHCCCTASACIGGRILASNISEKTVSQYGGIIFLLFGFHSLLFEK